MNVIKKSAVGALGYQFVESKFLPKGCDEYWLRNQQHPPEGRYRQLSAHEIEGLVRNRNTSDDWNQVLVQEAFDADRVQDCKFFGLVRIGKLEACYLEFHNLRRPVGLYNSTIISCDLGDNVVIDNVNFLSHYLVGNEVMLVNNNEVATTDHAKFGNGILKEGEPESIRIWLEVCNENGGRRIIPFEGMLPGDAFLWSRYRADGLLQERWKQLTEKKFDRLRGYYGSIGDRTVIKNCRIVKDVLIGSDAYIKGANKLKNLTVRSTPESMTQIGEGCELVNGIIGPGCRIFYGVKAVRFVMASHSQLKYGARLINSYLGNNATISCCEVLNSLIFPFHEQHHNNSFLCAALFGGQTNMAAGATIGSNHNSRGADGELIAGRGFWPGLCVSLKHNSRFASFVILAKGDFPAELHIPLPFSLVSNKVSTDELLVMPAYWFLHNLYALTRNARKYAQRDQRIEKIQRLEYDYLAPDSVGEIVQGLRTLEEAVGRAWLKNQERSGLSPKAASASRAGKKLLTTSEHWPADLEVLAEGFEHSSRKVRLLKVPQAYRMYRDLISFYAADLVVRFMDQHKIQHFSELQRRLPTPSRLQPWENVGGQLMPEADLQSFLRKLRSGKVQSWDAVHQFYRLQSESYDLARLSHALAALQTVHGIAIPALSLEAFLPWLRQASSLRLWMRDAILESRKKDYTNPFRQMVYESAKEMEKVIGRMDENAFIEEEILQAEAFTRQVDRVIRRLKSGKKKSPRKSGRT